MSQILEEIKRKTPVGTRLRIPDNSYNPLHEVTGHENEGRRLKVNLCNPTGKEGKLVYTDSAYIDGDTIYEEGTSPVVIESKRD